MAQGADVRPRKLTPIQGGEELTEAQREMLDVLDRARHDVLEGTVRAVVLATSQHPIAEGSGGGWATDFYLCPGVHRLEAVGVVQALAHAMLSSTDTIEAGDR